MKAWCIVADDFTGTGDTAVKFCTDGLPVRLLLGELSGDGGIHPSQNVVIDTDSRLLEDEAAYAKVRKAVERLHSSGYRHFFKKIDSTLRGNISAEVAAVMDGAGYGCAIVAPAAPRNGRTVSQGICLVDGVPIGGPDGLCDPFTPVAGAQVSSLFEPRFAGGVDSLCISSVRSGNEKLRDLVRIGRASGTRVFIADAESLDDLAAIASLASEGGLLFVGSSGLAEALSEELNPRFAQPHFEHAAIDPCRCVFIVGSVATTTTVQCEVLASDPRVSGIELDCAAFEADACAERERMLSFVRALPAGQAVLLRTDGVGAFSTDLDVVKEQGARISRFLGELGLAIALERQARFLFVSGGDTAARLAEALGVEAIDFVDEILPGIPLGHFSSRSLGGRVLFVSKSGGFGAPDAMVSVLARITAGETAAKESLHA
jgi:D-threonate/D-erythronate kinase